MGDLRKHYAIGSKISWWHSNSCSTRIQSLNTGVFLGRHGSRTISSVKTGLYSNRNDGVSMDTDVQ